MGNRGQPRVTFSIVARCRRTGQLGVAAATELPAVGKLLAYAAPGAGAVATQGTVNPYLGIDGVRMLAGGRAAAGEALREVLARDPAPGRRQLAMVDRAGRVAQWTGAGCGGWAGERRGDGFAAQGNLLAGPQVLQAAMGRMAAMGERPLVERLLAALEAGEAAGGDRRGTRSAAVLVVGTEEYPLWDARVDEHPRPLEELRRLLDVFRRDLVPLVGRMPRRAGGGYTAGGAPD